MDIGHFAGLPVRLYAEADGGYTINVERAVTPQLISAQLVLVLQSDVVTTITSMLTQVVMQLDQANQFDAAPRTSTAWWKDEAEP